MVVLLIKLLGLFRVMMGEHRDSSEILFHIVHLEERSVYTILVFFRHKVK